MKMNMEVKGTVTALCKNNIAKVMIERASMCGGKCAECQNTCGNKSEIFVKHSEALEVGDTVIVSERSQKVLLISTLVFMLPLAVMIIAYNCALSLKNETLTALASLMGGIVAFLLVVIYFRRLKMPVCKKI